MPNLTLLAMLSIGLQPPWSSGTCYAPTDQTPGWKKVALPADAPALAAPDDVDQFRGAEAALVVQDGLEALEIETPSKWGQTSFSFRVDPLTVRWLSVTFLDGIQGAKVDVAGLRQGRSISLRRGRRERGGTVAVGWEQPFDLIVVTVRHHLRTSPVVRAVELGARPSQTASSATGRTDRPLAYQSPGFLYFKHPGGRDLRLCNRDDAILRYHHDYWDAAPRLVDLLKASR